MLDDAEQSWNTSDGFARPHLTNGPNPGTRNGSPWILTVSSD